MTTDPRAPTIGHRSIIGAAVLAPSSHNTQPWIFQPRDGAIRLHLEPHEVRILIDGTDTGKTWKGRRIGMNGEQRRMQLVAMAPLREWGPSW